MLLMYVNTSAANSHYNCGHYYIKTLFLINTFNIVSYINNIEPILIFSSKVYTRKLQRKKFYNFDYYLNNLNDNYILPTLKLGQAEKAGLGQTL